MPRRMIDTGLWSDDRFTELSAPAQLVYLRLVTGDETGPAGATRVTTKRIAGDLNLERPAAAEALAELLEADLVRSYEGGWLWLPAFIRYQLSGPQFIRGIRRQAAEAPEALGTAINATMDAIVGPGREAKADARAEKSSGHRAAKNGTEKAAVSRGKEQSPDSTPTDGQQTTEGTASDGGLFEREVQDQDQDQDSPTVSESCVLSPGAAGAPPHEGAGAAPAIRRAPTPERWTRPSDGLTSLASLVDASDVGGVIGTVRQLRSVNGTGGHAA